MSEPLTLSPPAEPACRLGDLALDRLGLLAPLPAAFLASRDLDLLAPLRFLPPGSLPPGPPPRADRGTLAGALAAANRGYGHPAADRLASKLASPAARVVVTGQQPGLFGGPLYAFSKAVAAARWAERLEREGQPAVAVFWVATEDHDWAESATATVLASAGPRAFDLGPDPAPLAPLGLRTLGPGVEQVLAEIEALGGGPGWAEEWRRIAASSRPESGFGESFAALLVRFLGERCPLLLDAGLPELKAAERPWMRLLVERRAEVEAAYAAADQRLESRGYRLQVAPQRGASPLFLLDDGARRRIEWRGEDGWVLRGGERAAKPVAELLSILDAEPDRVSPGVLARAAIQDAVLGTSLQVLGPGEMSYMAQAAALYPVLGIEAPWTTLRPQALVLEARHCGWLADLELDLADLLAPEVELDRKLAARAGGDVAAPLRALLERELATLRERALLIDRNLESPWQKTRDTIERALGTFADKASSAAARADQDGRRRVEQLRALCLPGGKLQERVISTASFFARHGDRFGEVFWEQLELDAARLAVIRV